MLKQTSASIVPSLTKLFNLSLRTGTFPDEWKNARVVPIPKSGDLSLPTNYCPTSILPVVSKLLERHMYKLIHEHMSVHSPISVHQWGFSEGKSTTSALISFTHDCLQHLDNGEEACSVFFDISKAFDTVSHAPLMDKLTSTNVNPHIAKWVHSYLSNRSQHVVVNGCVSVVLPVISSVPQGSVLGPYLFLVYINKIVDAISVDSKIVMFADDIALYRPIRSSFDFALLQLDVDAICNWISLNYLTLNILKCCYMIYTRKRYPTLPTVPLVVNNHTLAKVDNFKYLGVNLSTKLSWSEHVNCITTKARRLVGLLYRRFYGHLGTHIMVKLYTTIICPHLEYACTVWSPYLQKDIQSLENIQKFALRVSTIQWTADYETLPSHGRI